MKFDLKSLKNKSNYAWRVGATGFSFASFGLGGVLIGGVIAPLVNLSTQDQQLRQQRAQQVIRYSFKGFVEMMVKLGIMTYEVEGLEKLQASRQELIIANHPTLIDVVVLIGLMEKANCVVKQSLWDNPSMRGPIRAAGYISNSGSLDMLDEAAGALQQGQTLIVFPEGTRTTPGQAPEFHRGAAAIAVRGASVVTPVVISVTPTTLTKAEPWYSIPSRRFHFRLRVGEDIDPRQFTEQAPLPIASRKLNDHLHQHFMKELATDERSANRD